MKYIKYIELGFERIDVDDAIEFKETGYSGFILKKTITDKIEIYVNGQRLDIPKLYIRRTQTDSYHIINITPECVIDLCSI
jgi:hypothetical protein